MFKCLLCSADFDLSRHAGFCLDCEGRAIWGIDHLFSRIVIPARLGGQDTWWTPEQLELAERTIIDSVRRLDTLYGKDGNGQLVLPSDPVRLMMLSVTVVGEVDRLRSKVSDLTAEVEHFRNLQVERIEDLAELVGVDDCQPEKER